MSDQIKYSDLSETKLDPAFREPLEMLRTLAKQPDAGNPFIVMFAEYAREGNDLNLLAVTYGRKLSQRDIVVALLRFAESVGMPPEIFLALLLKVMLEP